LIELCVAVGVDFFVQRPNCDELRFVAFQIWHFILSDMGSISSFSSSRTVYPAPQRTALPSPNGSVNYLPPLYLSSNPLSRLPANSMASSAGWHHFLINQHSNALALVSLLDWREVNPAASDGGASSLSAPRTLVVIR
jgi:hypothetical protein